jgi:hypothetical protein
VLSCLQETPQNVPQQAINKLDNVRLTGLG